MIVRRQFGLGYFRRVVERRNNATDSFDQKLNVVVDVAVVPVYLRQKATDVGSTETPPRPRRRAASSFLGRGTHR